MSYTRAIHSSCCCAIDKNCIEKKRTTPKWRNDQNFFLLLLYFESVWHSLIVAHRPSRFINFFFKLFLITKMYRVWLGDTGTRLTRDILRGLDRFSTYYYRLFGRTVGRLCSMAVEPCVYYSPIHFFTYQHIAYSVVVNLICIAG